MTALAATVAATPAAEGQETRASDVPESVKLRAGEILNALLLANWKRIDRLFAGLLVFQWLGGIIWALWRAPRTWEGGTSSIHPHVWQAIVLGGLIIILPLFLATKFPGRTLTRHVIAFAQMLSSALLIHISGGRIETHFHVFGSLAFIAFYRDWRVLITASAVVAVDHLVRNFVAPESVYGILTAGPWRWLEHASWVVFEDIFLFTSCYQGVREISGIARQRALLEESHATIEEKVKQRTEQLREAQSELLRVARSAGKAEVATSVLHNVGNVLNSLNVSLRVATGKVKNSPVSDLVRAVGMIGEHKGELGSYLTQDERGRLIPEFLSAVAEALASEQTQVLSEMRSLEKNVEHIKQIVSVQQSNAKGGGMVEGVRVSDLIDDAIRVAVVSSEGKSLPVDRQFAEIPEFLTDKHLVLQILINLLSNAKHAMSALEAGSKKLQVRTSVESRQGAEMVRIQVIDNGMGIDPANLTRIFNHGFTTKKEGHGFGLHASANSARQLGGSLAAHSAGPGTGAAFTLELPLKIRKEAVNP
jgi:signal transduction histidine kinase